MKLLRFLLILVLAYGLTGCSHKEIQPQDLAQKIYSTYNQKKYMHFKLTEHYVYKGQVDTITTPYEAWLLRDEKDKKLGGWAWVENYYRPYKEYYDLHNLFVIYPSKHKIRQYNKVFTPLITYADWTGIFFHPGWLMSYIVKNPDLVSVKSYKLDGRSVYELQITEFPAKGSEKKIVRTFVLDAKSLIPVKASSIVTYRNDEFRNWLEFSDVDFKPFDTAVFRQQFEQYASKFPPIPYDPSKPEEMVDRMLKTGQPAPEITGVYFNDGKPFKLSDFKGKVIVLDFWYTHCPPCVRAIPRLSELYNEYHDKGLEIFGLNSIDPADEKFFKFIDNLGMSYPAIKTESAVDRMYKIIAYPSIYVIDRNGKVAYIEVGFNDKKFEELKEEVKTLLGTE